MSDYIIEVKNAGKKIIDGTVERSILSKINYNLKYGQKAAIIGPSGCGKTTMLQCMAGLDRFSYGSCFLCGHDLTIINNRQLNKIHNTKIGFVYQQPNLLADFNVLENIAMPLLIGGKSKKIAIAAAINALKLIDLAQYAKYNPHQLSGGMKQKVAIARAFINNPAVILADEPTGNLDIKSRDMIMHTLLKISSEFNTALCIVTHDEYIAKQMKSVYDLTDK